MTKETPLLYDKNIDEIEEIINENLNINQINKVSNGEVFTPLWLILEMFEHLPDKVWKNPNLKWLDAGSGIGNFSMILFYKLDKGLKSWEKNNTKRRNHILKNMLYMIELSSDNVKITNQIFGNNINISENDFLSESNVWKNDFKNIEQFDIIFGNPPYNKNGMRGKGRSNPGLSVIWNKFVEKSLTLMKPNGYCLFFTPNSWTELKSSLSDKILDKQILVFKNFDVVNAYKIFEKKAGSLPLCYYLIENKSPYTHTLLHDNVFDEFVSFDLYKHMFIPNRNIKLVKKVLDKSKENMEDLYHFTPPKVKKDETSFFDSFSQQHPYPLLNYVHKKIYVSYSKQYSRMQNGRPKLLLPNYSMGYPILDKEGIMDVGGRSSYVIYVNNDKIEDLKKIQAFFLTDLALTLINSLKTAQKFLSTRTFSLFPDVCSLPLYSINDNYLVKYFKLGNQEKKSIEYQVDKGEGNLTEQRRNEITKFDLNEYLKKNDIEYIKDKLEKAKIKDKKTFKTIKKRRRKKKSVKSRSLKNKNDD